MRLNLRSIAAPLAATAIALTTLTPVADAQSSIINQAGSPVAGYDPFYDDPVADLGAPGTLLRTQPAPHLLNILGPNFPGYAEKILYTSTTVHGEPVATSGFVINPANPWIGPGPTPTIVFAPGTRGSSDACAASRGPWMTGQYDPATAALGLNYELPFYEAAALLGMRVVVTDYIGLGTPGPHTYVLHDEEAHAVLDAARATVPAGDPIAFYGYSQGGGAAAAAAEKHPTYAPELNLKGTYAGAPPADLIATLGAVDNSTIVATLGYAANGWKDRFPQLGDAIEENINDRGREFISATANSCIPDDILRWNGTDTSTLTTSGISLANLVDPYPELKEVYKQQSLGHTAPESPIMVTTTGFDDIVPSAQVTQLARDYCAANAEVTYLDEKIPPLTPGIKLGPNHAIGAFSQLGGSFKWVVERFIGAPVPNHCGTF